LVNLPHFRSFLGMTVEEPGTSSELLLSLADYERAAEAVLDPATFAYYAGGAGDELTMRDNIAAWQRLVLHPRTLVGVGQRDTSVTVLGRKRAHPLIIAPTAYHRLAHPDAELATATAAAVTQTIVCLATFATTTPAALAEAVPDAPRWFQVYVLTDRGLTREIVARAIEHHYEALVVTADLPVVGARDRELRSEAIVHSPTGDAIDQAALAGASSPADFAANIDPDLRWSDIEQLAADSQVPVIVKGILTPEDAVLAVEHGAAGIVVSNHGGRQLDTVLASADALGPVVEAVGDRLEVLVDGGIRRGTDVLKALALGARAVMVGRPVLWGLAVDGAAGAQRALEILLDEFDKSLALTGTPRAEDLSSSLVTPAPAR
jgi:isopentenyl diphosphate isomerase/L-lactate dehydrogenase-like FMN-dependent dehydrogenase